MPRLSKIGAAALAAFGWTGLSSVTASYLVVAGGGGGGRGFAGMGAGGAGGLLTGTTTLNPTLSYTVTVGAGGAGATVDDRSGVNGNNSVFNAVTATGGGFGGAPTPTNGGSGGSGGGGSATGGASTTGGSGTVGQGNAGGNGFDSTGGGGGGAGAVGSNGGASNGGNGGNGSASSISGTSVTYAGGGGGGSVSSIGSGGSGGTGGGGAGSASTTAAISGTANLGGGGGGGGRTAGVGNSNGGSGGSGVVIISYPSPQKFGGGIVTSSGGNTIHTFQTSGTLSPLSSLTASYLVVAGGASGGSLGGGGAGGLLSGSGLTLDTNSIYVVTVGAGASASSTQLGNYGSNSNFFAYTTTGGGRGEGDSVTPQAGVGGSGGGGGANVTTSTAGGGGGGGAGAVGSNGGGANGYSGGAGNTPSTSPSQGNNGGTGGTSTSTAGNGGNGSASSISGTSTTYAGGGGGGAYLNGGSGTAGTGGTGGGGNGGRNGLNATAGTANTGGGGGANGFNTAGGFQGSSGAGGSGVVIISYPGSTQLMAGGTVTISGGNVIHTFTSSGYLTPIDLVGNSLRFRASASAYLNRTPTTASNRKTWTWSAWVKRGGLSSNQSLFAVNATGDYQEFRFTSSDNLRLILDAAANNYAVEVPTVVWRDPAAWYHIVLAVDTTQATSTNRVKIYVNGIQQTVSAVSGFSFPAQNFDTYVNATLPHAIGNFNYNNSLYFDGYMTEVQLIDGQALTPNSFGTFNSYGVWQPIVYGGSYGTNGFYLPFSNTTSTTTLGFDFSPNGNNWTANNISLTSGSTYDSMTDVPTLTSTTAANYATFNPLLYAPASGYRTLSNGNLTTVGNSATNNGNDYSTQAITTGKWYVEFTCSGSSGIYPQIGIIPVVGAGSGGGQVGYVANSFAYFADGTKQTNGTNTAYGSSFTTNNIIGIAIDADNGAIYFSRDGVFQNSGVPTSGASRTGAAFTWTGGSIEFFISTAVYQSGTGWSANFGQRTFSSTPPSGFLPLNTFNL
jgi:hypothetical protein